MNTAWPVGDGRWVAMARPAPARSFEPGARLGLDRRASAMAERWAVTASGLRVGGLVVSRAHTRGVGAAVVGAVGIRLGVDLVPVDRVTERHRAAVLSARESAALTRHRSLGPALAWGIKEAAAKATGDPLTYFPAGLRLEEGSQGIIVRLARSPETCFQAAWRLIGGMLCVWVWEVVSAISVRESVPLPVDAPGRRTSTRVPASLLVS